MLQNNRISLEAKLAQVEAELARFAKIKELYNLDFDIPTEHLRAEAQNLRRLLATALSA